MFSTDNVFELLARSRKFISIQHFKPTQSLKIYLNECFISTVIYSMQALKCLLLEVYEKLLGREATIVSKIKKNQVCFNKIHAMVQLLHALYVAADYQT